MLLPSRRGRPTSRCPVILLSLGLVLAVSVAVAGDPPWRVGSGKAVTEATDRGDNAAKRSEASREFLGLGIPPDAAAAGRGKPIFESQCSPCHGLRGRGGMGPSLIHSSVVLDDERGEKLAAFLKIGRPDRGMPGFSSLSSRDRVDISEFLHQEIEKIANRGAYENTNNILVGDRRRGEVFVAKNCLSCHALAGDLRGVGGRWRPLDLQRNWIFPPREPADGPRAFRAVVTTPDGVFRGRVRQVDDFSVVLVEEGGAVRAFERRKDVHVQISDPLQAHRDLARRVKNRDMTDVTTYLETLK